MLKYALHFSSADAKKKEIRGEIQGALRQKIELKPIFILIVSTNDFFNRLNILVDFWSLPSRLETRVDGT